MRRVLTRLAVVTFSVTLTAVALLAAGRYVVVGDVRDLVSLISQLTVARSPGTAPSSPEVSPSHTPERVVQAAPRSAEPAPVETATPSPSPRPTAAAPLTITPFRSGERNYLGLIASDAAPVFVAPFAGRVEIRMYQLIDGQVRVGSNVPSLPFFPYVAVVSEDRRIIYRPGALGSVTEVLVLDGEAVGSGARLFRLITAGRSSWATFYDPSAPYQVVVSLQAVPGGRDLDASSFFGGS